MSDWGSLALSFDGTVTFGAELDLLFVPALIFVLDKELELGFSEFNAETFSSTSFSSCLFCSGANAFDVLYWRTVGTDGAPLLSNDALSSWLVAGFASHALPFVDAVDGYSPPAHGDSTKNM